MHKLIALGVTLGVLLVAGTLWAAAGRSSEATPQQADTNATWATAGGDSEATPQQAGTTTTVISAEEFPPILATPGMEIDYDPYFLTVVGQTEHSDLIVVGEVVQIDPARWNSPDGKRWIPEDTLVVPLIFRTFWVQPTEVLKGSPTASGPLPFFVHGGIEGEASAPVDVGETVLVFGREAPKNTATDGYWPEGYQAVADENGIYQPDEDQFVRWGGRGGSHSEWEITTLDQLRQLVASGEW